MLTVPSNYFNVLILIYLLIEETVYSTSVKELHARFTTFPRKPFPEQFERIIWYNLNEEDVLLSCKKKDSIRFLPCLCCTKQDIINIFVQTNVNRALNSLNRAELEILSTNPLILLNKHLGWFRSPPTSPTWW